ncbi:MULTISPECIES: lipoprotein HlpB [unclassified Mannheimia]|uniref:lipoprotein HlpB n=1 Tax=unclassified Mannheimia TaxID=2645054 RepID=UPI00359E970C
MNKFTKISATALVALFLAACEKPAQKVEETAPVQTTIETTKSAETTQIATPSEAAKADYQKLATWNAEQKKSMQAAQAELQQKLATQDPKQMQEGLVAFNQKVEATVKSLDAVDVSDAQLKELKEKSKSALTLSSEVLNEQVKVLANPTDEALRQSAQKKAEALIEVNTELQRISAEVEKRFSAK